MNSSHVTEILHVDASKIHLQPYKPSRSLADGFILELSDDTLDASYLRRAAAELRTSDVPVAFPTETVYGLGADATRSSAVQGIFRAKQRPTDNPLIVHIHSLEQLRLLLQPAAYRAKHRYRNFTQNGHNQELLNTPEVDDPIPPIYHSLISRFWPGPLTLLMPNPPNSVLAPEVTASLPTFGARMPRNKHALALLKLADVPLAAPSANASTKPSPTEAEHVKHDLDHRISTIIDGGPCQVGVESTVVDGLCDPPIILRPGGISIEELRSCPGWENVTVEYKDASEQNAQPRAPGMKYRHYSPKASVILYEYGRAMPGPNDMLEYLGSSRIIGIVRTMSWTKACGVLADDDEAETLSNNPDAAILADNRSTKQSPTLCSNDNQIFTSSILQQYRIDAPDSFEAFYVWDINLGKSTEKIAQGIFAALRALDLKNVDAILVEGIDDSTGDVSAAVMNRLRKAAEVKLR